MLGNFKEDSNKITSTLFRKRMNSITRFSTIGIPMIIGMGIAWGGNRIIKNEKGLKDRELELMLQLNNKFDWTFFD